MPTSLHRKENLRQSRRAQAWVRDGLWTAGTLALPVAALLLALWLPTALVLPALAIVAIAAGFTLEGARVLFGAWSSLTRLREYAAGLVFAGLAASILADGDAALLAFSEFTGGTSVQEASDH